MSTAEIIEWHEDGWFKGNICGLAVLTFFLSSPGLFDKMGGGRFISSIGILALLAFFVRPVRFIYGGACDVISYVYWAIVCIFMGLYFVYIGERMSKNRKMFIGLGAVVTITQLTRLGGYATTCKDGNLMGEEFQTWTMYAGAVLFIVSAVSIVFAGLFFKNGKMPGTDVRLKKLDLVSRVAFVISPLPLIGSSLASFAGNMKDAVPMQLVLIFSSVYLASVSHITMFLYDSLSKYMKAAMDGTGTTTTNVNNESSSIQK